MRNHRSGEPDAGKPPVRFGGRGKVKPLRPDPYQPCLEILLRRAAVAVRGGFIRRRIRGGTWIRAVLRVSPAVEPVRARPKAIR